MAGEIKIIYEDVYGKTAEQRAQIASEMDSMESECEQIQTMFDGVDSENNADLKDAMETNKEKTQTAVNTTDKLLSFMDNSSKQVETSEQKIKSVFAAILNLFKGGKR